VTSGELHDERFERALWCELPFPLRSKSNFRRGDARSAAQWRAEQSFRSDVATLCAAARPQGWDTGSLDVALSRRPCFAVVLVAASTLDTANLSKSVLDALEGVLYVNDAQVRFEAALSQRRREHQRAVLAAAQLPASSTSAELAAAGTTLVTLAQQVWEELESRHHGPGS